MATYNKFQQFTKDLIDGAHDFDAHVFKVMLTNTVPLATNTVKANITEISAGSGYSAGGTATTITTSTTTGTSKATGTDVVFTAAGGPFCTTTPPRHRPSPLSLGGITALALRWLIPRP